MANINIRIDEKIKKDAEKVFKSLGLTPSAAINLFYIQVIRTNSIPFELKANELTKSAIEEVEEMDKGNKESKTFSSVDELMEDLDK